MEYTDSMKKAADAYTDKCALQDMWVLMQSKKEEIATLKTESRMAKIIFDRKCDEVAELRQQLAAAQNDVKQLRQSRDKRKPEYVRATANGIYDRRTVERQDDGTVILRDPVTRKTWAVDGTSIGDDSTTPNEQTDALRLKIEVDKPRIIASLEKFIQEISGAVGDAAVTPACEDDGWIEWHGGKCPVQIGKVECKLRSGGYLSPEYARDMHPSWWCNDNNQFDIIAYRLVK